ncbi:hypothetical protein B0H34DRAFT_86321 [Crassisporium funariophilum]|nr:hypothetical protein B0H34DRAFT_86321 [Crassisporium funariophilum]
MNSTMLTTTALCMRFRLVIGVAGRLIRMRPGMGVVTAMSSLGRFVLSNHLVGWMLFFLRLGWMLFFLCLSRVVLAFQTWHG